jgi:hypothetical protein
MLNNMAEETSKFRQRHQDAERVELINAFRNEAFKTHIENAHITDWVDRLKQRIVEWDHIMSRELGALQLNRMYNHVRFLVEVDNVFTFRPNTESRNVRRNVRRRV